MLPLFLQKINKNIISFNKIIILWEHGPVVEEVYQKYKKHRSNGIPFNGNYNDIIEKEDEEILIEVYNIFAKYSAWGFSRHPMFFS